MTITSQPSADGRELTIVINGRFDFNAHQAFREAYLRSDVQPQRYVLDLQGANYLDSSALGMLLLLRDHAGGDEADIRLLNCNPDVRRILQVSNFEKLFVIA
ncbi:MULTISPECIES: STAS domain-containing protein [Stutzerimonas]|jgi:anti-anti-sigma factor|uniref:Anti-anti-sigma factor n=2 Tax=Stutzerimonas balearica TaxID=74829 RepID=A0A8D3Y1W7_9GAMM|nr:STAS domain-containing protein [Stutzerimonas balearica]KIL05170.1 anti-anti-sigma factor [Stutzerimonas stutzeri]MBB62983.1 anti-sigma factor antagonist [Pseudomonas sp.]MBZ5756734.1 STAS domain-containing protein [Pseudomonas sp. S5(2021)]WIX01451.1 STAS domain-containing protein [Pseudomonas sp. AR5]AJE15810.1 anti-anti-sigma factor [Stutzerimonas balearica DSM 6083]